MIKCIDCDIEVKYGPRCRSCSSIKKWEDGCFENSFTEERRQRQSLAATKQWSNPDNRRANSIALKVAHARGDFDDRYTDECRRNISIGVRKAHNEGRGNIHPHTEESKIKMGNGVANAHARGCYLNSFSDERRKKMSDNAKLQHANGNFGDGTKHAYSNVQVDAYYALLDCELVCEFQKKFIGCSFIFDIYLPDFHTIIEIDGDFWHYSEWAIAHGIPEKDARRDEWAVTNGYDIIHVPVSHINDIGLDAMVWEIVDILEE